MHGRSEAAAICRGDCDADGHVSANEVAAAIDAARLGSDASGCAAFAPATTVTIELLVASVLNARDGCPSDLCSRIPASDFEDHTEGCLASAAEFDALAVEDAGRAVAKFVITDLRSARARAMRYYDGNFYTLHDEWYWFRLLNGQRVPGDTVPPVTGLNFASIAEIYAWARPRPVLPLDLRFGEERLYSGRFYRLSLEDPRQYGLGSLLRIAAHTGDMPKPERWLFELEYIDFVTYPQLVVFFETLAATLPAEIGSQVGWLVRSPAQEQLARRIETERLPYHDRIVRFADLAVPGETEVYSAGISAGRLRRVALAQGDLPVVVEDDIVVLDQVPDALPLVAGLLTAVPQTPLAHLNLLARSRKIPNAYRGGVFEDPLLGQLAEVRAPVALRAREPDELDLIPLTEAEYATWRELRELAPSSVEPVELGEAPYTIDLATLSLADADELRPLIGGKSTGFLALMAADDVTPPEHPLALTIRAYAEHVAPLRATIQAMLADASFNDSARVRYLVLEGEDAYVDRYPPALDQGTRALFLSTHPRGNPVGNLARDGGLKTVIRARRIAPATLAAIQAALEAQFASFSVRQALRFRSSSTVEDIEGFVGAGLYESNSGFLDAAAQPGTSDKSRTVERALKKTWSSYWNAVAVEERRAQRIDHLSGNMGVLVHARFDDDKELANAVSTFTVEPANSAFSGVMEINAQAGATSVTNPGAGASVLPEVNRVRRPRQGGELAIERVRASSIVPAGQQVLDDAALRSLFAQTEQVTLAWLAQANAPLRPAQRATTVVLDFEMRHTDVGWPALATGPAFPARLILKQARSLDPGLRRVAAALRQADIPRDVLAHARRVEERTCSSASFTAAVVEVYTDSLIPPDLGYDVVPFTAGVSVEIGAVAGVDATHLDFVSVAHTAVPWGIEIALQGGGVVQLSSGGAYRLELGEEIVEGADATCTVRILHASPEDYLATLLDG